MLFFKTIIGLISFIPLTHSFEIREWDLNSIQNQHRFVCLLNLERAEEGVPPLALDVKWNAEALRLAENDSHDHFKRKMDPNHSKSDEVLKGGGSEVITHFEVEYVLSVKGCLGKYMESWLDEEGEPQVLSKKWTKIGLGFSDADRDNHVSLVLVDDGDNSQSGVLQNCTTILYPPKK